MSVFMEDWHHSKTRHFNSESDHDYKWLKNDQNINCHSSKGTSCSHIKRHQRHRGRVIYNIKQTIDCNNLILQEKIDSIHAFIFHPFPSIYHNILLSDDEKHKDIDETLWNNNPKCTADCNLSQILHILKDGIIFNQVEKLQVHEKDIFNYIKDNCWDGIKLNEIKRKTFLTTLANHLKNKKLKASLGKLYNALMNFELKIFTGHMHSELKDTADQPRQSIVNSSKFTTSLIESDDQQNGSYYAFGEQYRYTKHFKNMAHPLYVAVKYKSIKQELFEYCKRLNQEEDEIHLRCLQMEKIDLIKSHIKSMLQQHVSNSSIKSVDNQCKIWKDNIRITADIIQNDTIKLITLENANCCHIMMIISKLCNYLPANFSFFTDYIFICLLDKKIETINEKIRQNLTDYWKTIDSDNQNSMNSKLRELGSIVQKSKQKQQKKNIAAKFDKLMTVVEQQIFVADLTEYQFPKRKYFYQILSRFKMSADDFFRADARATSLVCGYIRRMGKEADMNFPLLYFGLPSTVIDKLSILCSKLLGRYYYDEMFKFTTFFQKLYDGIIQKNETQLQTAISDVYQIMNITKNTFYRCYLQERCKQYPSLQLAARQWSTNKKNTGDNFETLQMSSLLKNSVQKQAILMRILNMDYNELKTSIDNKTEQIRSDFEHSTKQMIKNAIIQNRYGYLKYQNTKRSEYFINIAKSRFDLTFVKQIKAMWYHGMNEHHNIRPDDTLQME
eukprot:291510_1